MSTLVSNNSLIFGGGVLSGVILTVFWMKYFNSDYKVEEDYTPSGNGTNKLVLIVRNDLKMGKGKVAAQCSHAAVMAHELSRKKCPNIFANWKRYGQPKIVVKIDSEDEMLDLADKAKKYQLLVSIVQDAGRTQIPSGSRTVLAVGPGPENLINEVTGHLKLY